MTPQDIRSQLLDLADVVRATNGNAAQPSGKLGKYRIDGLLGSGGESVALLGWDPDLRREVVLKVQHNADDDATEKVLEEGRALARIQSPYVAKCHTVETFAKAPCLVLEYVKGQNLSDRIRQNSVSRKQAADIVEKLAIGVQAVHQCGIVHRDLKPSNVIISDSGQPKIIDFGLSSDGEYAADGSSGTAIYLPPERAKGLSRGDQRGDVFGLGAILFELLTGSPPFAAENKKQAIERSAKCQLSASVPDPSHPLSKVCLKCLSENPEDRYSSAEQVAAATRAAVNQNKRIFFFAAVATLALVALGLIINRPATNSLAEPITETSEKVNRIPYSVNFVSSTKRSETIWVDGSTTSGGSGTKAKPFQSIKQALQQANANCIVRIRGRGPHGQIVYRESGLRLNPVQHKGIQLTNWGTQASSPDSPPILDGGGEDADVTSNIIDVCSSETELSNLSFQNASGSAVFIRNDDSSSSQTNFVAIGNCRFLRCQTAIRARRIKNLLVEETQIDDCTVASDRGAVELEEVNGAEISNVRIFCDAEIRKGFGIALEKCADIHIHGCEMIGLNGIAVLVRGSSNCDLRNNMFHRCNSGIHAMPPSMTSVNIVGNILSDCSQSAIAFSACESEFHISRVQVSHNTIYRSAETAIEVDVSSSINTRICNNVMLESQWGDLFVTEDPSIDIRDNLFGNMESEPRFREHNLVLPELNVNAPQLAIQKLGAENNREEFPEASNYMLLPDSIANDRKVFYPSSSRDIRGVERDVVAPDLGAVETR